MEWHSVLDRSPCIRFEWERVSVDVEARFADGQMYIVNFYLGSINGRIADIYSTANQRNLRPTHWRYIRVSNP